MRLGRRLGAFVSCCLIGLVAEENEANQTSASRKDVKPVVEQVDSPQDLVIERPTDWPVVRLDNVRPVPLVVLADGL